MYGSISRKDMTKTLVTTKKKEAKVAKRGLREERETIIRFDESDGPVSIYTFNADLKRRLKAFAKKYPDLCIRTAEDTEYGSMTYELEKTRLSNQV